MHHPRTTFSLLICVLFAFLPALVRSQPIHLSNAQAEKIGRRLWQNECGGTVSGLTSWNSGENFASLGIGHFIWYPIGQRGPFKESFPPLLVYLKESGVTLPAWLAESHGCPWTDRAAFLADLHSSRLQELRTMLANTVPLQARFAANRLEAALPKMLAEVPAEEQGKVKQNFYRVAANSGGMYPLVDYVNFKGEGTSPTERYRGQGWGLLQVLETMNEGPALEQFKVAASQVLTRRVHNAPPERHEERWLSGWLSRLRTYGE